jgi:type VI secretion system Hcp family effector
MERKWVALLFCAVISYTVQAQNIGGFWLSGTGITGEGTGIHNGEMQVLSIEDSIEHIISTTGAAAGKLVLGNFKFKKSLNANSVFFFALAGKGTVLPNLVFKFYEGKLIGLFLPVLTITLSNVIVTRYRISSPDNSSGSPQAMEEISLFYDKIQLTDNAGNSSVVSGTHL